MSILVPAILPASRTDLEEKLAIAAETRGVTRVQIDAVDGRFATPAAWPYTAPAEFQALGREGLPHQGRLEYEVDLMCMDAETAAGAWLTLGASRLTFHAESSVNPARLVASARRRYGGEGVVSFGLALNIASDLALLEPALAGINYVQFMGIKTIGRQGQPFERRVLERIRAFRARHPDMPVQVDGGVSPKNAKELVALGVSSLIMGSAFFADPAEAVRAVEAMENPFGV